MSKIEKTLTWRRLDNSAKIFPISTGKKYSTVFRLSAVLTEPIKQEQLEKALKQTLKQFPSFKVRMNPASGTFRRVFSFTGCTCL